MCWNITNRQVQSCQSPSNLMSDSAVVEQLSLPSEVVIMTRQQGFKLGQG